MTRNIWLCRALAPECSTAERQLFFGLLEAARVLSVAVPLGVMTLTICGSLVPTFARYRDLTALLVLAWMAGKVGLVTADGDDGGAGQAGADDRHVLADGGGEPASTW